MKLAASFLCLALATASNLRGGGLLNITIISNSTLSSCDASSLITKHEGSRSCSYKDTTGHITVGVGFNMDAVSSSTWARILPGVSYSDVYSGKTCLTSSQISTLLHYSMQDAIAESKRVVSNYN